jgi:hypothetical protein
MKNLSSLAKVYILGTILVGFGLILWQVLELDWSNPGLVLLATLGAVAQTLKVEGPDDKTNYNIAWFVYGFTFIVLGRASALFVVLVAHLVEWIWHRYPWYIQTFNIGAHAIPIFLAGFVFEAVNGGTQVLDLNGAIAIVAANLVFVLGNHSLVGLVINFACGQSFAESGVFGFLPLSLDFIMLTMGAATALIWQYNPSASLLNILPLYLLYNSIRVPALKRQLTEMKENSAQVSPVPTGD